MLMRDARYSDVENVMDQLSDISLQEMAKTGVVNAWQGLKRAKICKDTGFLKIMEDLEGPLFIFGAVKIDVSSLRTWFIATERYFNQPMAAKGTAKAMRRIAKAYPHHVFETISLSNHPASLKWFQTLGFEMVKREGPATIYRYVGKNSTNAPKPDMVENTRA
jgi:hypothetical protein